MWRCREFRVFHATGWWSKVCFAWALKGGTLGYPRQFAGMSQTPAWVFKKFVQIKSVCCSGTKKRGQKRKFLGRISCDPSGVCPSQISQMLHTLPLYGVASLEAGSLASAHLPQVRWSRTRGAVQILDLLSLIFDRKCKGNC